MFCKKHFVFFMFYRKRKIEHEKDHVKERGRKRLVLNFHQNRRKIHFFRLFDPKVQQK